MTDRAVDSGKQTSDCFLIYCMNLSCNLEMVAHFRKCMSNDVLSL